ncbi:MAG: hypothetical protein RL518_1263 [Pseudomonadota bacterium]
MIYNRPGEWVEVQMRILVAEGFELADLREVVRSRDRMLGATSDGPTTRLPWSHLGSEESNIAFVRDLANGAGVVSPLGDRLALAVRMTDNLRLQSPSPRLLEAIDDWFESMCGCEIEETGEDDRALCVILDYLRRQLGIRRG